MMNKKNITIVAILLVVSMLILLVFPTLNIVQPDVSDSYTLVTKDNSLTTDLPWMYIQTFTCEDNKINKVSIWCGPTDDIILFGNIICQMSDSDDNIIASSSKQLSNIVLPRQKVTFDFGSINANDITKFGISLDTIVVNASMNIYGTDDENSYPDGEAYKLISSDNYPINMYADLGFEIESSSNNVLPIAIIDAPTQAQINEPVLFDGTDSYDPDGSIVAYRWNFGGVWTQWGPPSTHGTFENTFGTGTEGWNTVKLKVQDNELGEGETEFLIDIYVHSPDEGTIHISSLKADTQYTEFVNNVDITIEGPYDHTETKNTGEQASTYFNNCPFGDYTVTASKTGYLDYTGYFTMDSSDYWTHVYLTEDTGPDIYTVRVKVVNELDEPLEGVSVNLKNGIDMNDDTDSSGYAIFTDMDPGDYDIIIDEPGYFKLGDSITISSSDVSKTIKLIESSGFEINMMAILISVVVGVIFVMIGLFSPISISIKAILISLGIALGIILYFVITMFGVL